MSTLSTIVRGGLGRGRALALLVGAVGMTGCLQDGTESEDGAAAPIASFETGAGRVDFYEPEPGRVVVFSQAELADDVEDLQPRAMYEALSGRTAPVALREAQERADRARAERQPGSPAADRVSAPERSPLASLSSADFQASFCNPGSVDFDYCWPNSTNNYSIDISSVDWIHAHVNAVSGAVTMSMYYRTTFGGWNLMFSDNVSGSGTVITQSTTDNDRYLVQITNASGDTYHLAIHGDK
jgi:hypothetical protein